MPCGITLAVLGVLGIVCGALTLGLFSTLFDYILATQMSLTPESFSYGIWQKLPDTVPLMTYIYFFNCTNWEEIQKNRNGIKPNMQQIGPYVWRQYQEMDNVTINNNHTYTYYQNKTWIYQPHLSCQGPNTCGDLDDIVTAINPVAVGAAASSKNLQPPYFNIYNVNNLFKVYNGSLFLHQPVRNFTFDGIVDNIMAASNQLPVAAVPFDKFGWFYSRNNSLTFDGRYNMFTGTDDFMKTGQIWQWNGDTKVPEKMYTSYCGMINGSAGEFFPAHRDKTYIDYFSSDMCRSLRFTYTEEVEVKGVSGYKYVLGADLVNNTLPQNECFNPYPDPDIKTVPDGLFNVSTCKYDSPAYVSYPHFLNGDQMLIDQFVEGNIKPDVATHQSYIVLEPLSGVPLEVAVKLQINMLARPVSVEFQNHTYQIDLMEGLDTIYYPMIWFETVTSLDDSMVDMMKAMAASPSISLGIGIGSIIIGLILCALSAFLVIRHRRMTKFA